MNKILRFPFLILLTFVMTFAIACESETVEVIKEVQVVKEIPVDKGSLVIYSGRKESLVGPIIEQFEAISGIKIEVKYGSSGEIASQIILEGNKTPADVFYAQDPGAVGSVVDMLQPISTATLDQVPDWAKSNEGKWIGVSGRARTLVYNTDNVKIADMPNDLNDLCDPKWKGRMGWAPTNSSFQTMLTAMRKLWGEEKALAWVKCMMENDVKVYPKNTPQVEAAGKAEIDIGLVNHYYLYKFVLDAGEGDKFKARNLHLDSGGPGSLVMVSPIGILNTSSNKDNAEHFVNFMLSKVAQNYFVNSTREYPLIEGVKTHPLLTPLSEITKANINLSDLADIQGSIKLLQEAGALPK
tara:strand:- start:5250 stop:6314 length:1065 start_codon:yes stop_codon:yes gene_type:complete